MIKCCEKSCDNIKTYSEYNKFKKHIEYLQDVMIKHQTDEICVHDVDISEEVKKRTGSRYKSLSSFLFRLTHFVQGRKIFEDIGIFYYPSISYKGCRVYKLKTRV